MPRTPARHVLVGLVAVAAGAVAAIAFFASTPRVDPTPAPPRAAARAAARSYDPQGACLLPVAPGGPRPNIIFVVIDTLRADAIEPRGDRVQGDEERSRDATPAGAGPDMPFLAGMGRDHVTFRQAGSPSPWTLPALCSLLTSILPSGHPSTGGGARVPVLANVATLADILRTTLGYHTVAAFGGLPSGSQAAFARGYDRVEDYFDLQGARATLDRSLAGRRPSQPFHLLLHTYEAHDPYGAKNHPPGGGDGGWDEAASLAQLDALGTSPRIPDLVRRSLLDAGQRLVLHQHPRYRALRMPTIRYLWDGLTSDPDPGLATELEDAYRRGARWVDDLLEAFVADLARRDLLENTLLVVTSDHGEAFGEHGMLLHARQLYDELIRVPLVMRGPPPFDRPQVIQHSVGTIGLLPTLLDWLGLPPQSGIDGTSFLPLLQGNGTGHPVISEEVRLASQTAAASVAILGSVRDERWKYIATHDLTRATVFEELYDLHADPGERRNLPLESMDRAMLAADAAFCAAVERVRDRVWGSVEAEEPEGLHRPARGQGRAKEPRPEPLSRGVR